MADVDFGDLLDYLALDRATRGILLYVEAVTQPRKFMSAARIAARAKPVIVVKAGRHAAGARAALSHTGALAGSDIAYDAAFRRAGVLRVSELREVFEAFTTLASGVNISGGRLGILTNGGGLGVMAADALEGRHGDLATLSPATVAALSAALPSTWSHANPVDIVGDASGERYQKAIAILTEQRDCDALLVINCPTAVADSLDAATKVAEVANQPWRMPILTCWVGEGRGEEARRLLAGKRIPSYETPDEAVRAFMHLVEYRRIHEELLETPPAEPPGSAPDRKRAWALVQGVLDAGRTVLTAVESKGLLTAFGIPVAESRVAPTAEEAARIAATLAVPVALKILSPDISHKTDVGGVRLSLPPALVLNAAREMLTTVRTRAPKATIDGFTIEPMVERDDTEELLIGIAEDTTFGPVVVFGHGGVAVEAIADRVLGLPPLNRALARQMITRTRVFRLLQGYRNRPAANLDLIAQILVRVSQMATDIPELVELDINPLLAWPQSVIALDARAVVRRGRTASTCLTICPYPAELAHEAILPGGERILVRPIRPQDEPGLVVMVARSALEDIRLRFFQPLKEVPHQLAARLSQIDYDREMAFVATPPEDSGEIFGVGRLAADPDNERAEYAVMVRSDLKARGIGYRLMKELLAHARRRGVKTVFGEVLRENRPMLEMVRELGFAIAPAADPAVVEVTIRP
jgi:acetyltransferase